MKKATGNPESLLISFEPCSSWYKNTICNVTYIAFSLSFMKHIYKFDIEVSSTYKWILELKPSLYVAMNKFFC